MKPGMTLNYRLARATLLSWEEVSSNMCSHIWFLPVSLFRFSCYVYVALMFLATKRPLDLHLLLSMIRFLCVLLPVDDHADAMEIGTSRTATPLAYTDAGALRCPAPRCSISTPSPDTTNVPDSFTSIYYTVSWSTDATVPPRALDVPLRFCYCTTWSDLMLIGRRNVLVSPSSLVFFFFAFLD